MIRSLALIAAGALLTTLTAAETTPKVQRLATDQWCWTHDLPKDKCVTCDRKLIPALKKAKDWCPEHAMAESVCALCDPQAPKRIEALRPAEKLKP